MSKATTYTCRCGNIALLDRGHPTTSKSAHEDDGQPQQQLKKENTDSFHQSCSLNFDDGLMADLPQNQNADDDFSSNIKRIRSSSTLYNSDETTCCGLSKECELQSTDESSLLKLEYSKMVTKKSEHIRILMRYPGVFEEDKTIFKFGVSSVGIAANSSENVFCLTISDSVFDLICIGCGYKLRLVAPSSAKYGFAQKLEVETETDFFGKKNGIQKILENAIKNKKSIEYSLPFQLRKFVHFSRNTFLETETFVDISDNEINDIMVNSDLEIIGSFNFSPLNAFQTLA